MAEILIAGALESYENSSLEFIKYLGEEVVKRGHTLINGCCNEFDKLIAKSAFDYLNENGLNYRSRIISYAKDNSVPIHAYGTILNSQLETWGLEHATLYTPEPIDKADVVIIVGGKEGTLCAVNWARIANKPLLPVTAFGGAGKTTFNEELKDFEKKYSTYITKSQYEILNQVSNNLKQIAEDVVALAARINVSKDVLVLMSFATDPRLEDAYESYKSVCSEFDYECIRIDDSSAMERIVPEIFTSIKKAAFIIADLTDQKPNVYYELGYAHGIRKPVVVTAFKGTELPFDIKDIPTIFWESQKQLKEKLKERIITIAGKQGR